jgi:hypothetical protein
MAREEKLPSEREALQSQLDIDCAAFLANGGKVTYIEPSNIDTSKYNTQKPAKPAKPAPVAKGKKD